MNTPLDLNNFSTLMIITLAKNSRIIDLNKTNKRVASLPVDYKQRIEDIMHNDNWKSEFSLLINADEYFEDHFAWERHLSLNIRKMLKALGKSFEYDFENDSIDIVFSKNEVDLFLSYFTDENVKNKMDWFVGLLNDYSFSREYKENNNYHEWRK